MPDEQTVTQRTLDLLEREWTKPYRDAIETALAELNGLGLAALNSHERECLQAAVHALINAARKGTDG